MSLHLTSEELIDLTGYKHTAKQAETLAKMKIGFREARHGKLKVLRADLPLMQGKAANDDRFDLDAV